MMERRNKQIKSCMQMPHRSEFLVYVFLIFHGSEDTKHMFCIISACQSSCYLEPAGHHRSLSARLLAAINGRIFSLCPLVWLADLLLQRIIPMKSAKNAMRLMRWPPSETVEEDQCCGQSQVSGLYPAVCLSELP